MAARGDVFLNMAFVSVFIIFSRLADGLNFFYFLHQLPPFSPLGQEDILLQVSNSFQKVHTAYTMAPHNQNQNMKF
jgi:hypothetical protein